MLNVTDLNESALKAHGVQSPAPGDWASVPCLHDADGWFPTSRGHAIDGACRLDDRFRGPGSWAVRRLGGSISQSASSRRSRRPTPVSDPSPREPCR